MNQNSSAIFAYLIIGADVIASIFSSPVGATTLAIKALKFRGDMPYVQSDNVRVAQRINDYLYLQMLELPAPVKFQDGLKEKKAQAETPPPSPADLNFKVGRNDDRVLALSVDAEGCGAYCEHFTNHLNFDLATGRHVTADDVFTPAGAATLGKKLATLQTARWKAEIAKVNKALKTAKPGKDDEDTASETIDMYEQCVAALKEPDRVKNSSLQWEEMKIGNDAVTFIHGRCSIHAQQAIDEVGEIENTFTIKELTPNLSDYGKALLLGAGNAQPNSGPFNQVLAGKIGASQITFKLGTRNSDNTISGLYYYNKYRTPIALFGKLTGNTLEMEESDSKDKVLPVIRATINGETLKGQWIGGGKQIAFEAAP